MVLLLLQGYNSHIHLNGVGEGRGGLRIIEQVLAEGRRGEEGGEEERSRQERRSGNSRRYFLHRFHR